MIQNNLIHVFSESQKVSLSKSCHFVFTIGVLTEEHVVDSKPNLCFNLRHLIDVLRRDFDPFLILKLLKLSLFVLSEPWFKFNERDEDARNVIHLHHLMANRNREILHVVANKSD